MGTALYQLPLSVAVACGVAETVAGENRSERRLRTDRCLRNGLGKRLSRWVLLPRTATTGGFGAPRGSRGKKPGFNCPRRGGLVYTSNRPETKTEIPAYNSDDAENATFDSACGGMEAGFGGTFVKLEAYLAQAQG